ncbi:N-terminal acetyltransferase B complex subunit MDM20 [Spathaspora sp. JA1]|nr:N-terminal acetyltransferase B complex subunit MDM20 [Spathaspora sp. JA1]
MATDTDLEILDLIDRGSYGYAKTLLAKKVAKYPQKLGYQALQNKILYASGQQELAIKNNVNLLGKLPNDPFSIEALRDFFVEAGMEREANLVYENAIKKYPISSTQLSITWWETSIEKFDVKLFNKIFMYLYKNDKSSRLYTFWYSFSFYLLVAQANNLSDKEITLYKSLGKKIIHELTPFENTQELYVYVNFLLLEGDYSGIEDSINSAGFNLDLDLKLIYLDALKQNSNWGKLYAYCQDLLLNQKFNDFDCWKLYILACTKSSVKYEDLNGILSVYPFSRNSLLAQIELAKAYPDKQEEVTNKIDQYYDKLNHKLCCYFDLVNFVDDFASSPSFLDRIESTTQEILQSNPTDVNQLTRLINNQKFILLLETPGIDFEADFLTLNWKIYQIYKDNTSIQGGEFDNNPLNELNLISIILDLSRKPSSKNIIKNIGIINWLLQQDKYNHKLKLWLIKLYSQLNSFNSILPVYQDLKIKMTQHETLNHYLTNINPSKQNLDQLVDIYRFYLTSKEEIKSGIIQGFNSGVFNKLESFLNFGKRLNNSISLNFIISKILQFSLVVGDAGYLNYFINYLKKNSSLITSEEFYDNRDFTSEWKLGLNRENYDLLKIPLDCESEIKLKLLVYSILFEENPIQIQKLLKSYNKILSNAKISSPFDNLLFKLYFNFVKIVKSKLNNQEAQSLFNFIQKNLKFEKLKLVLIPQDLLSSELNQNLTNLAEFLKIIQQQRLRKSNLTIIDQLISTFKCLIQEIKQLNLVSKQLEQIDSMVFDLPFVFDITSTTTMLKESITTSSTPIFNALNSV